MDSASQLFYILAEKEQLPKLIESLEQYRFAAQAEFADCSNDGNFFVIQGPRVNRLFNLLQSNVIPNTIANIDTCSMEYGDYHICVFRHTVTGENGYFLWVNNKSFASFKNMRGLIN